jgi:hypothetical protein
MRTIGSDPTHWTWIVARISSSISRHRFDHMHGEEYARLSRDQSRLGRTPSKGGFLARILSVLVFGASLPIVTELEQLMVDDLICTIHWRQFVSARLAEWHDSGLAATFLLAISFGGAIVAREELVRVTGFVAALLAAGSLLTSTALRAKYARGEQLHAVDVWGHVSALRQRSGYHVAAAMLALPRALQLWALLGLCAQIVLAGVLGLTWGPMAFIVCGVATFIGLLIIAMGLVLSGSLGGNSCDSEPFSWTRFLPFKRHPKAVPDTCEERVKADMV